VSIIPHRKSPVGVARNFILQNALFDRIKKESTNTVGLGAVREAVKQVFPDLSSDEPVFPEGYEAIHGLVLCDTRGTGVLDV
jgi:hypothetical protein